MADTIFTRALAQASAAQESSQGLAHQLRVPESTLLRWMSGRAQMPLQAFLRVIELLVEHEKKMAPQPSAPVVALPAELSFNVGEVLAACARCSGTRFLREAPAEPLGMTSLLACASCGERVGHGELLARLAAQAMRQTRVAPARSQGGAAVIKLASR